ncbi:class I SAM-dependent methyltransferase [Solidesulfovibrio alcoholivorans]|uniref:class I SAM-dependent methyltransferase n=1 Tax=Solidesulfovibrio alcoholivorans TaxID=81406 RepID=UPI0004975050|nr:class I SAM-dependent methyltransferase [Solidesulfovibrio alcoholivorans]
MTALFDILNSTALVLPEERLALHAAAAAVPAGGIIVEVGTYNGMSALLMRRAAPPTCRVHAVDPFPQPGAVQRLSDHGVTLFQGTSRQFAAQFQEGIDLLLIDGDHSFHWVREDFMALAPLLRPGAVVAFHDAGVLPFWGIRLLVDVLELQGTMTRPAVYIGQLALGRFDPAAGLPTVDVYVRVARDHLAVPTDFGLWKTPADHVFEEYEYTALSLPHRLKDVRFIGRGLRGWLIKTLLDLPGEMFIDSGQARDPAMNYLVVSAYWTEIYRCLTQERGIPGHQLRAVTEFTVSRLLYADISGDRQGMCRLARDAFQREFLQALFAKMPGHELLALHHSGMLVSFFSGLFRGFSYDFGGQALSPPDTPGG